MLQVTSKCKSKCNGEPTVPKTKQIRNDSGFRFQDSLANFQRNLIQGLLSLVQSTYKRQEHPKKKSVSIR